MTFIAEPERLRRYWHRWQKEVTGVEIVEEAVYAAAENAKENQLDNCTFLAGDVLTVLDELTEAPDAIVLDPPREGIHPKAIRKILDYGLSSFVYISCKPTSLARDLEVFLEYGYQPVRAKCRYVSVDTRDRNCGSLEKGKKVIILQKLDCFPKTL